MEDLHLADFVELQLKSKHDFIAANDVARSEGLGDCMRTFAAIEPGAWPCQFYCRHWIIYGCPKKYISHNPELGNIPRDSDMVVSHNHSFIPFHSRQLRQSTTFHITWRLSEYFCLLFQAEKNVVISFHPFFKYYESIFLISKFGGKTKPWKIRKIK